MTTTQEFNRIAVETNDGLKLSLSVWQATRTYDVVFYIHGLQSHSGWMTDTAKHLNHAGITLVSLDRRGSGQSGGLRGHSPSGQHIINDYIKGLEACRSLLPDMPLHVMSQSFGGSILSALLCQTDPKAATYMFVAPALGQQRARHNPDFLDQLRKRKDTGFCPVNLRDSDYTTENEFRRFMANDFFILRLLTNAMRASMIEIEDVYSEPGASFIAPRPTHLFEPSKDNIINSEVSRKILNRILPKTTCKVFPCDTHYLEFSPCRHKLYDAIAQCVRGGEKVA